MIMGDTCTRACAFCDVKTGKPKIRPIWTIKIANAVKKLNLKHVVITSVDRDDLMTVAQIIFKKLLIETTKKKIQIQQLKFLTPDFLRKGDAYKKVT